jgi:hypothetical protein
VKKLNDWAARIDDALPSVERDHYDHFPCYARTVSGDRCQLPAFHYPGTLHCIVFHEGGFICWNDFSQVDSVAVCRIFADSSLAGCRSP